MAADEIFMNAIDRVLRAYLSTRKLSEEQTVRVRIELAKFIDELRSGGASSKPPSQSEQ